MSNLGVISGVNLHWFRTSQSSLPLPRPGCGLTLGLTTPSPRNFFCLFGRTGDLPRLSIRGYTTVSTGPEGMTPVQTVVLSGGKCFSPPVSLEGHPILGTVW